MLRLPKPAKPTSKYSDSNRIIQIAVFFWISIAIFLLAFGLFTSCWDKPAGKEIVFTSIQNAIYVKPTPPIPTELEAFGCDCEIFNRGVGDSYDKILKDEFNSFELDFIVRDESQENKFFKIAFCTESRSKYLTPCIFGEKFKVFFSAEIKPGIFYWGNDGEKPDPTYPDSQACSDSGVDNGAWKRFIIKINFTEQVLEVNSHGEVIMKWAIPEKLKDIKYYAFDKQCYTKPMELARNCTLEKVDPEAVMIYSIPNCGGDDKKDEPEQKFFCRALPV